ncbi:sugar ABC transporter ATP-binding protein [Poseidonocella sp. HB161398]|uniref:sugar ABC transporter ATP-binding protein n=1 Tax=Poseidonocella sp. HB161398 TaxID=2320855 RepID=UPI001108A003|nr:sugar ABC transporter ATP-binding protein [Poseidonocella sp. HB161398]
MLVTRGLTKTFGSATALQDVDFTLEAGEVHALLGENGAGKSTLINLICGTFPPSAGTIEMDGRPLGAGTVAAARAAGIAPVFQEFSLAPDLTVLENLFLGREKRQGLFLQKRAMRREAEELLAEIGFALPLDRLVSELSRAQKQMTEIAKALRLRPRILILDEPTASLTDGEARHLFRAIGLLRGKGVGILYVSHRMSEIRALSDRVTVLRGGRHIGTVETAATSDRALIEMMVGRPVEQLFPAIRSRPAEEVLRVEGLATADGAVEGASITLRRGEIVGLAGLVGCGRSELCRAVFGLDPLAAGEIALKGETLRRPSPNAMIRRGLCYFPGDRAAEGLALARPARENAGMAALRLPALSAGGTVLKTWREGAVVAAPFEDLGLRPMAPELPAGAFSGGNQQKVMLARGLLQDFDVYLFDEPTVGIDVGAKADVYRLMKRLVEGGAGVVVSTSELPELIHLADRIYVMHAGRVVTEIAGKGTGEAEILSHYFGE